MATLQTSTIANQLTVSAGSVSAPSITFSGNTNTGIYFPADDQIAIACNGAQQMLITQNGVRMPNVPVFSASNTTHTDISPAVFTASNYWNTVSYNNGSNVDTSTGRWTATVAGYYVMWVNFHTTSVTGINVRLRKNGSTICEAYNDAGGANQTKARILVRMEVGDFIDFQSGNCQNVIGGVQHKRFLIFFVG